MLKFWKEYVKYFTQAQICYKDCDHRFVKTVFQNIFFKLVIFIYQIRVREIKKMSYDTAV